MLNRILGLLLFFIPGSLTGQTTYIDSQAMLDSIGPGLIKVQGSIWINDWSGSITDLSPLGNLEEVSGSIRIESNHSLQKLEGLSSLQHIGGSLEIEDNLNLESIDGFERLDSIRGGVLVGASPFLTHTRFSALRTVGSAIDIYYYSTGVMSFSALQEAATIKIESGSEIYFDELVSASSIDINGTLSTGISFPSLIELGSLFYLRHSPFLTKLSLPLLQKIDARVDVNSCELLEAIEFPALISARMIQFFSLDKLRSIDLNSLEQLATLHLISCPSLSNVQIEKLSVLDEDFVLDDTGFGSLLHFDALKKIVGFFQITDNSRLKKIDLVNSLDSIGDYLLIEQNLNLQRILGFKGLRRVNELEIVNNQSLETIEGLGSIIAVDGPMIIGSNEGLRTLPGFNALTSMESLRISNNFVLEEITGFSALSSVDDISISNCSKMQSISGFQSLESMKGLSVNSNYELIEMSGFDNLVSSTRIGISRNSALRKIEGFEKQEHVIGFLFLAENPELSFVSAWEKLETVNADVTVRSTGLTDLDFLGNLERVIMDLTIQDNEFLSDCCAIKSLIESDVAVGRFTFVLDNAYGCDDEEQVLEDCDGTSTQEQVQNQWLVYPNPASNYLEVQSASGEGDLDLSLRTLDGRLLITQVGNRIDVSWIAAGLYQMDIIDRNTLRRESVLVVIE